MGVVAPGLGDAPHQGREVLVGDICLLDLDLEEAAVLGIERRLPKLFGVHFAEALVALDREALAAGRRDAFEQLAGAADEHALGRHSRSEEHKSELQSLMRKQYAVF